MRLLGKQRELLEGGRASTMSNGRDDDDKRGGCVLAHDSGVLGETCFCSLSVAWEVFGSRGLRSSRATLKV